jgi:hypothetical protein
MTSEYQVQAQKFLDQFGLKFRATFRGDRCPPWCGEDGHGCIHGDRYRVTISRKTGGRVSFDFWNSQKDMQEGKSPTACDALACISSDATCPDNFEDFCAEYGYETDSRKAETLFRRVSKFAARLQAFFTSDELEALAEIQ